MKVPKLFELSGFTKDLIVDATSEQLEDESWMASAFVCITVWLGFLNQKPVKGMFVNEQEKPLMGHILKEDWINHPHYDQLKRWEEAEKKVIFKGFKDDYGYIGKGKIKVIFYGLNCHISHTKKGLIRNEFINSLHDLAQATNGELELQNVKL
jgi:hypothetical protein